MKAAKVAGGEEKNSGEKVAGHVSASNLVVLTEDDAGSRPSINRATRLVTRSLAFVDQSMMDGFLSMASHSPIIILAHLV